MSSLLKAWYTVLALIFLTFILTTFVGSPPYALSSAVALPHNLFYQASFNLREAVRRTGDKRDLLAEVARLETQMAVLQSDNEQLGLTLERYRQVLTVRELQSRGVALSAPVIGVDSSPLYSRLVLGSGKGQGVTPNMPVTVPNGLVGIITGVADNTAQVRTLADPESRVGVAIRGRGGQGIAVGEVDGMVRVSYSERDEVQVGDVLETSSRGGLFPRGITVGSVVQVLPRPNSLRTDLLVRPAVDLPSLQEVALIEPL